MPRTTRRPRRLVAACVLGVAAWVPAMAVDDHAVSAAPSTSAHEALDWLGGQLASNGGSLPAPVGPGSDWGITADAVLAHVAAGRGDDPAAQTATDLLLANVDAYSSWNDLGPDLAGVRLAGPLGKILLAAEAQGRDVSSVGGVDLEAELRSLMVLSGGETGRIADRNPHAPDNSNGFGQALSMLALSYTDRGMPTEAIDFLLAQQCPNGGFRLFYSGSDGCASDIDADPDSTAVAVQALLAAPRTAARTTAMSRAISWLASVQDPTTGGWAGSGPTATVNANSTGLAVQALRAAGHHAPADRGAAWIRDRLQLTSTLVAGTPASGHAGAIAYQPGQVTVALRDGLTPSGADQWRRATAQGVLALGLDRYGAAVEGPLPTTTTVATTTVPSTTVPTTTVPSSAPITSTPTTSAPGSIGGAPLDPPPSPTVEALHAAGVRSSGPTAGAAVAPQVASTRGPLALTGADAAGLAAVGVATLLVGLILTCVALVLPGRGVTRP